MTGVAGLKLALLGCGDVAQRDYLPELYRLADRVELVAVCSRTAERARAVAAQYGARAWYTDYARMLAESDADLVANLTPIQLHAETTAALGTDAGLSGAAATIWIRCNIEERAGEGVCRTTSRP